MSIAKNNIINQKIQPKVPSAFSKSSKEGMTLASFQQALLSIHDKRKSTKNSYEKVIASLEQIIE